MDLLSKNDATQDSDVKNEKVPKNYNVPLWIGIVLLIIVPTFAANFLFGLDKNISGFWQEDEGGFENIQGSLEISKDKKTWSFHDSSFSYKPFIITLTGNEVKEVIDKGCNVIKSGLSNKKLQLSAQAKEFFYEKLSPMGELPDGMETLYTHDKKPSAIPLYSQYDLVDRNLLGSWKHEQSGAIYTFDLSGNLLVRVEDTGQLQIYDKNIYNVQESNMLRLLLSSSDQEFFLRYQINNDELLIGNNKFKKVV